MDRFIHLAIAASQMAMDSSGLKITPENAERVGVMVGDRVLTKDYVTREIGRFDLAELLARAAERLQPADLESVVRGMAR